MKQLLINNFKCFRNIEIPINGLTIFAGANGNGKSTAIQSLLFLRRTIEHCAKWEDGQYQMLEPGDLRVELNGAYCMSLGTSSGIIPHSSNAKSLSLGFQHEDKAFMVDYEVEDNKLWLKPSNVKGGDTLKDDPLFYQEFYYLNAERIGPRLSQTIQFYDFPNTGFKGEFVAQLIGDAESNYSFKVDELRRNQNSKSPRLEQQVNAWLDYLMPGVVVSANYDTETGFAQIKLENKYTRGRPIISTNIGFGISYVLPVIVTGLIARKGSYMIVENPEAHLHPSAQSKIGQFLAVIAESGVKVIVETHSDHVINGVQIAVADKRASSNIIQTNFFDQLEGSDQPNIEHILLNDRGELSKWPHGFFDQNQVDYRSLIKLRMNG
ncbi:AAA family ATPase [Marinoscillum sp.]|uniref:AAA family ATPase n=1 Tax=Marinoscillum sp. TaxID=2024838 RepID=UPI003BA95049